MNRYLSFIKESKNIRKRKANKYRKAIFTDEIFLLLKHYKILQEEERTQVLGTAIRLAAKYKKFNF